MAVFIFLTERPSQGETGQEVPSISPELSPVNPSAPPVPF